MYRQLLLGLLLGLSLSSAPAHPHWPTKHEAMRLHEINHHTKQYEHAHDIDGMRVKYSAETHPDFLSLLHVNGLTEEVVCTEEEGGFTALVLEFDSDESRDSLLNDLVVSKTLLSGTCKGADGSFVPFYGKLASISAASSSSAIRLSTERVSLKTLFTNLQASVSVSGNKKKTYDVVKRSLRGDEERLGLPGYDQESDDATPENVRNNWDNLDASTQNNLNGADIDIEEQLFQGFGFNYDDSTGGALNDAIAIEGQDWLTCRSCYAYIDDASVHVEMNFGNFGGPENVAAWIEGGMGANVEVEISNPSVATNGDGLVRISDRQQVFVFEFALGPIPVRWHVYSELYAKVVLENAIPAGSLAASGGVRADLDVRKAGVQWTNSGGWSSLNDIDFNMKLYPPAIATPDLSQRNSLTATLLPTITLSLYDAIPFVIRPMPSIGYDFGGSTASCQNNDGYEQFTSFDLGLGVGDIKVPDENGATIIGGFSRDFTLLSKRPTESDSFFGPLVCGSERPNLCAGCISDFVDSDAVVDLFKQTCPNFEGGCDSEQVERAARALGLSDSDVDEIKGSDDSTNLVLVAAVSCGVVAVVAAVVGGVWYNRRRSFKGETNIEIDVLPWTKKKKKKTTKKKKKKAPAVPRKYTGNGQGGPRTPGTPRTPYLGQGGLRSPRTPTSTTPRTPTSKSRYYGQGSAARSPVSPSHRQA